MASQVPIVEVFCDFLSPYSWLGLRACASLRDEFAVLPRPVVYGAILSAEGATGPGETPRRRAQFVRDVARIAALRGIEFCGPPAHPFRSLDALRVQALCELEGVKGLDPHVRADRLFALALALSDASWQAGEDLCDFAVLARVVKAAGFDATELEARVAAQDVKDALRATTDEALARGVGGVPTFCHQGQLFHGQDRVEHLRLALAGKLPDVEERAESMIARPAAVRRKR